MSHTPEPWVYAPGSTVYRDAPCLVWGQKGPGYGAVCHTSPNGIGGNTNAADARRIVACVNALAGVPTEVLENLAGNALAKLLREKGLLP